MKPLPHQITACNTLTSWGYCGLLSDDMGLGKTFTSIYTIKDLPGSKLIVCPTSLVKMWQSNLLSQGVPASVISYGSLHKVMSYYDVIVFDECHYIKNIESRRCKAARRLCKQSKHCLFLSGTPMTDRPRDVFPALNIICEKRKSLGMDVPGEYYLSDYWRFVERFCGGIYEDIRTIGGKKEILISNRSSNEDELHEILKGLMIRRLTDEVIKLPKMDRKLVYIDNSDEAKFRQQLIELEQYEKGYTQCPPYFLLSQYRQFAAFQKLDAIVKLVQSLAYPPEHMDKVIIGAYHNKFIKVMTERLRMYYPLVMTGETPKEERQVLVDTFQNDPKHRIMICNILVGGEGHTLTAANHCIIAEWLWTPKDTDPQREIDQFPKRIHRIGQTKDCTTYYTVLKNSLDEYMLWRVLDKKESINKIL